MSKFLGSLQSITHYSLHLLFPGLIAYLLFRENWEIAWLIMVATMLIDLDHLLANPKFDETRCSLNFHPLHSYWAISIYFLMLLVPNTYVRIIAVGILLHIFTDLLDCLWIKLRKQ